MDLGIEGRVALVMGASKGLGRAIATSLAAEGAHVAIASRSRERLDATVEELEGHVTAFVADAGDLDRLADLPGEVDAELGPIDILVANTGGPPPGLALDNSIAEWEEAYRSLVLGLRVLVEGVLPGMRDRGWGRIVNIGSSSTVEPIPSLTLSNANRLAAIGFLKTLAREVAADGVTANSIQPGSHDTERIRSLRGDAVGSGDQRIGEPDDFGKIAAFLCSEQAKFLTGAAVHVDGGAYQGLQ
jgi:3-oxoacyl-[acyl-carrier protein] reductase